MPAATVNRLQNRSSAVEDSPSEISHKSLWRRNSEKDTLWDVDEGRKRVIGIMAAILAARKLAQWDGGKRVPATVAAISDGVRWAEEIMREIDQRWPISKQEVKRHDD
jgi:hypothetical protein